MLLKKFAIFACMWQESPSFSVLSVSFSFFFRFRFLQQHIFFTAAYFLPQRPFRCARAAFIRKEKESPSLSFCEIQQQTNHRAVALINAAFM